MAEHSMWLNFGKLTALFYPFLLQKIVTIALFRAFIAIILVIYSSHLARTLQGSMLTHIFYSPLGGKSEQMWRQYDLY